MGVCPFVNASVWAAVVLLLGFRGGAWAAAEPAAGPAPVVTFDETAPPVSPTPNATGDWGGLRPKLAAAGWTFGGLVQMDVSQNFHGGLSTAETPVRYLLDFNATFDLEKTWHWPGGELFIDFQSYDGPNASTQVVGDLQGFDSIDATHFIQFSQLWYQQKLWADTLRLKAGKIDANSDFEVIEHGRAFLNSSMSFSTSMFPLPTYPDPAPGGELFWEPDGHWYVGSGVYYSNSTQRALVLVGHPSQIERFSGGMFYIGEAGYRGKVGSAGLPTHVAVGGWGHTGEVPRWQGGVDNGTGGFYAYGDQSLWHEESKEGEVSRDLGMFVQYGWSDPAVAPLAQNVAGGWAAVGWIPWRPKDGVGAGVTWAHLGDQPNQLHAYELAVEGYYQLQLAPWAFLRPDLQYINYPGGIHSDALVFTLRVEIDF